MINEKYAVLITGFGKGIGRDILFECIKSKAYVIGITRSKEDIIFFKRFLFFIPI